MNRVPPMILVVEDDPNMAQMLELLLPLGGYVVIVVGTDAAAMDYVQRHTPDLILRDLHLPQDASWSLYHHLRAQTRHQTRPFILLTPAPPEPIARRDPFLHIIVKPFQPNALFTMLHTVLPTRARRA